MIARLAAAVLAVSAVSACALPVGKDVHEREREVRAAQPSLGPKVPDAPTVDVTAGVPPKYDQGAYEVAAGVVNISFTGAPNSNHNLSLVGPDITLPLLWGVPAGAPEDHLTYSIKLAPGVYTFFCSVQGHRAAGMEGTITVR